jgi:membrane protein required for colicin V production
MWLDVLALLILGIFVGMGVLRGALTSALSLITLGVAYGAALVTAPRLGPRLAEFLGSAELIGAAAAGMGAFLLAFVAMAVVGRVLRAVERRRGAEARSPRDRFLGGVFGGVRGALVVLLLAWLALWVDALRATGTATPMPAIGSSAAAAVTGQFIEAGVGVAMGDAGPSGRLMARMAARPGATLVDLQHLVESPQLEALRGDAAFWTYVENGAIDSAMNRSSFLAVAYDEELRRRLGELGLVDEQAAADVGAFREDVGEVLRQLGPRLRSLRNDPELRRLVEDPEIQAALASGNTLALVRHAEFRRVVARALEDPEAG